MQKRCRYTRINIHTGVAYNDFKWTCPKCGSQKIKLNGSRTTKAGNVRYRLRCKSCGGCSSVSPSVYKSYLIWQYEKSKKNNKSNNN